jgi:hypothetical protein
VALGAQGNACERPRLRAAGRRRAARGGGAPAAADESHVVAVDVGASLTSNRTSCS